MEQTSHREVISNDPQWSVRDVMAHLETALTSKGPALAFGDIQAKTVSSDIAILVNTTGSSGVVKTVALRTNAVNTSAAAAHRFLAAHEGQIWSLLLPLNHIAGVNILIRSLQLGTTPLDLRQLTGPFPKADFTAIVPTQLFRALNGDAHLLEHLRAAQAVLVGGAALSNSLQLQATDSGINIVKTYGSTETSGGCVYNGEPLSGVEVSIKAHGRIAIRGDVLAQTYLGAEELWSSQIEDGWFITPDTGKIVGGMLQVDGRADDVVISGGENISLRSIEDSLHQHYPTVTFAAIALDDPEWGQRVGLAIAGSQTPSNGDIENFLAKNLGNAAKPKVVLQLDQLPLIGIGKIDRNELKNLMAGAAYE